jgi:AhpD family alkylhydroperoxidase
MSTVRLLKDDELSPEAKDVFADIRATRGSDFINNFWRALAHDPVLLKRTWVSVKQVMGKGALDPMVKELIYIAVSTVQGCEYCVRSHTAAARAKGMTPDQHMELAAVVGMAAETNRLATLFQVPVDPVFMEP